MKVRTILACAVAFAPTAAAFAASCTTAEGGGTGSSNDDAVAAGSGSGGAAAPAGSASDLFDALAPMLLEECGACHQLGGAADAPFLAAPDLYVSITSWPGVVIPDWSHSLIITHPKDPAHGAGQAPSASEELEPLLLEWLQREASELPTPDAGSNAYIPPFKPLLKGAFNTIYLDPLGPGLESSSISFNAEELGSPVSMLSLTNLQVHPVADAKAHIVHPLFTVYPKGSYALPDPVDSFSTVDHVFTLGGDPTLGTGAVVLTNWSEHARLGLAFEKIEAEAQGGGIVSTCKDAGTFQTVVVPQLQVCATQCHGGTKAEAQAAMDLSALEATPPEAACAQVRARINPADPPTSELLIVTDPTQQAVHMYKFAGNKNKYNAFKMAVMPWITSEK